MTGADKMLDDVKKAMLSSGSTYSPWQIGAENGKDALFAKDEQPDIALTGLRIMKTQLTGFGQRDDLASLITHDQCVGLINDTSNKGKIVVVVKMDINKGSDRVGLKIGKISPDQQDVLGGVGDRRLVKAQHGIAHSTRL